MTTPFAMPLAMLPTELITMIAFLACTDGGYTGCSLALVSKHIRDATRPARFYSVVLASTPNQIQRFITTFQTERARIPKSPLRVQHLFLSLFGRDNVFNQFRMDAIFGAQNEADRFTRIIEMMTQFGDDQDTLSAVYAPLVPVLLKLVAPDVRTFALLQSKFRKLPTAVCAFPRLQELTLIGGDPKFARFKDVPEDCAPLYPALRRLHHIFVLMLLEKDDVDFVPWARHAPNLTHLKISRLSARPEVTLDTLLRVYSKVPEEDVLFPHLQYLLISPEAEPEPDDIAAMVSIGAHRQYIKWLRASLRDNPRVQTVFLGDWEDNVVGNLQQFHDSNTELTLADWRARIEGGQGCWSLCGDVEVHDNARPGGSRVPREDDDGSGDDNDGEDADEDNLSENGSDS